MAALASTLMAVSVTVLAPNQSTAVSAQHAFTASSEATLGQAVQEWSKESGLAAPQIDSAVASLSVGNIHVTGSTVCEAVARLVSALKYADSHPQMKSCGESGAVVVSSAR
jgi:hypothetical protein